MGDAVLSVEEFAAFQAQLAELGEENFRLKEQLEQLTSANAELPRLKAELQAAEEQRQQARERHQQTMQALQAEITALTGKVAERHESVARRIAERVAQVNAQVFDIGKQSKEKEQEIENLRAHLHACEEGLREKQATLEMLRRRSRVFEPVVGFLRRARGIPMFLEDISSRMFALQEQKAAEEAELDKLDRELTVIVRDNDALEAQIREKTAAVDAAHARLDSERERIASMNAQIADTQRRVEETQERARRLGEENAARRVEVERRMAELAVERQSLGERIAALESEKTQLEADLSRASAEREAELARYDEQITGLRRRLARIRETGDDAEIPRVDREIQSQIARVRQERTELLEKASMLEQAIQLVKDEIAAKSAEVIEIALRMKPTPRILASPDFQRKQLLLEELVLQNRELRMSLEEMTNRAVALRGENDRLREEIVARDTRRGE